MNGVNLIPAPRLAARRRAARIRLWLTIAPVLAACLMAAYAWLRTTWPTDATSVRASITALEAQIASTDADIKRLRAEFAQRQITLKAHRAVGEQPDWGILLHLLARRLGDFAVLSTCALEPAAADGASVPQGRPGRFRLTLTGLGRDQEAISTFLLNLEEDRTTELFDRVTLVESKRVPFLGNHAVSFRTECLLSDGAAEVK